ncbi:MAG: His-Xaa-Ser system protein HxsD [Labilithrix sp.]|nr:His-Xaa-Ser system protein HxsD [Labilithrix sp.]
MTEEALFAFEGDAIRVTLDLRVYRLTAIKKAAYRVADRCTAMLQSPSEHELPVLFTFKAGASKESAITSVRAFYQELLDQELREEVAEETGPMRALILAHAFSKTDLIRRE